MLKNRPIFIFLIVSSVVFCLSIIFLYYKDSNRPLPDRAQHVVGASHIDDFTFEPITPLRALALKDSAKLMLGRMLFYDSTISSNDMACISCHALDKAGAHPAEQAGHVFPGKFNSPSIYNTKYYARLFWDGRIYNPEDQIRINLKNGMGITPEEVAEKLADDSNYSGKFDEIFTDGVTSKNIIDALLEFQFSLISISRFDKYLSGENSAITEQEKEGYKLFKELGCSSCHQGITIGGNTFQKFGIIKDYFEELDSVKQIDYGLFNTSQDEKDKFVFRVPSLRNVAITAPYLHDGSIKTLEEMVEIMAEYQLGINLSNEEVDKIISFLNTLTGDQFLLDY
ncbi:cytochrome c peroxidase [Fulvivirgaceae bacterium BMA10]|uniref:Cytochrome c peroxidase n=1 Tax=Splendidivirga corallicola TaxID=3051826 RepID=A0ABT8KL44_9BACT|nr:cytochrome c peroxidase [Fulvivirgaceae bacterium BMA10]